MEKGISVVIPNYNGKLILAKNLPKVIEHFAKCQVIVVDDGSKDDSVPFIQKNFPKIKLIILPKNKGFTNAANIGAKAASGKYMVLINSDVSPKNNFLNKIVNNFKNEKLFAVGFADYSHEDGQIVIRGRGGGYFSKGFLAHFALPAKFGKTLWVSGGSAIFDKEKFLALGGFDENFAPFYWEDIDLSFRAWMSGYTCLFDSNAQVDHYHQEGAIKSYKSNFQITSAAYKNQFLFVWKNFSNLNFLTEHIFWLPYHFLKSALTLDLAFFTGFIWATLQIPNLIFAKSSNQMAYQLTEKEVLSQIEKS